jgi:hypothetical protein
MGEHNATRTLRSHLESMGAFVQRFEDKLSPGIPDTMACLDGVDVWLEGKFVKELPVRQSTLVRFGSKGEPRLAHQRNWHRSYQKAGGLSFIWVRVRDGGWYLFEDPELLVSGITKEALLRCENHGSAKALAMVIEEESCKHGIKVGNVL